MTQIFRDDLVRVGERLVKCDREAVVRYTDQQPAATLRSAFLWLFSDALLQCCYTASASAALAAARERRRARAVEVRTSVESPQKQ